MPIGVRQYQMAVALPGQRMSYQDYTHAKGNLDECFNAEPGYLPFGRFICKDNVIADWNGELRLPSSTFTQVIGLVGQQGYHEVDAVTGAVGIPANYPTAYHYKGVFAMETVGTVTKDTAFAIAADDADAINKGKLVDSAVYADNTIPVPTPFRVLRVVDGLAITEIDYPSTLIA